MDINFHEFETTKEIKDQDIAIISNLHLSEIIKYNKVYTILNALYDIKPSSILIPGNLYNVDESTIWDDLVADFISSATSIAPVYYIRGESELNRADLPYSLYYFDNPEFNILCEDTGYTEKHKIYRANGVNITGVKLPMKFYDQKDDEKIKILIEKYQEYFEKLANLCTNKDFNILMCHDPIIMKVADKIKELSQFDLVVSSEQIKNLTLECLKVVLDKMNLYDSNMKQTVYSHKKNGYFYPESTGEYGYLRDDKTYYLTGNSVTKFHSDTNVPEMFEELNKGAIDIVRIRKVKPVRIYGGIIK